MVKFFNADNYIILIQKYYNWLRTWEVVTLMEEEMFDSKENLDRVNNFDETLAYDQYVRNSVKANLVKKVDFSNRKLWNKNDYKKIRR